MLIVVYQPSKSWVRFLAFELFLPALALLRLAMAMAH